MAVQSRLLYAFRGWLAFVAFMDLGTAGRCYIERRSFLEDNNTVNTHQGYVVSRMLGMYLLLKALALVHCTLYIHYPPVVSLGYCSLVLTILLYTTEALYFQSAGLTFYVIFPCVLNALTLAGLVYVPGAVNLWGQHNNVMNFSNGSTNCNNDFSLDENQVLFKQLVKHRKPRHR